METVKVDPSCLNVIFDRRRYVVVDKTDHCFEDFIEGSVDQDDENFRIIIISEISDQQVIDVNGEKRAYSALSKAGFKFGIDFFTMRSFWCGK